MQMKLPSHGPVRLADLLSEVYLCPIWQSRRYMLAIGAGVSTKPSPEPPVSLYCQDIQRYPQLRDGRADFWMYPSLLLQRF
jgi:hypothetical protein